MELCDLFIFTILQTIIALVTVGGFLFVVFKWVNNLNKNESAFSNVVIF